METRIALASCAVIAWDDLGPESVKRLTLKDLPLIVAIDAEGNDAFAEGQAAYLNSLQQKGAIEA